MDSINRRLLAIVHAIEPLPPFNALAAYDLHTFQRLFLSVLPICVASPLNSLADTASSNCCNVFSSTVKLNVAIVEFRLNSTQLLSLTLDCPLARKSYNWKKTREFR
ncbi:hypothetical protein K1719_045669 [Acacia pycnantha]|nr:hypothetical protein K1719_045669 [Acacia pycnantha]